MRLSREDDSFVSSPKWFQHRSGSLFQANDDIGVSKLSAKIIIGSDCDADQRFALCRHNAYRTRIQVLTFDGLLNIPKRVLRYLEEPLLDDVPF